MNIRWETNVVTHGVTICDIVTYDMTMCDIVTHGVTISKEG